MNNSVEYREYMALLRLIELAEDHDLLSAKRIGLVSGFNPHQLTPTEESHFSLRLLDYLRMTKPPMSLWNGGQLPTPSLWAFELSCRNKQEAIDRLKQVLQMWNDELLNRGKNGPHTSC